MSQIGLAEAIEQLREELGAAQDAGANQQLRFEVVEVEMELLVELRKEGGGKVVGADGMVSSNTSHKLKLRLNVKDAALGNASLEVGDRSERPWEDWRRLGSPASGAIDQPSGPAISGPQSVGDGAANPRRRTADPVRAAGLPTACRPAARGAGLRRFLVTDHAWDPDVGLVTSQPYANTLWPSRSGVPRSGIPWSGVPRSGLPGRRTTGTLRGGPGAATSAAAPSPPSAGTVLIPAVNRSAQQIDDTSPQSPPMSPRAGRSSPHPERDLPMDRSAGSICFNHSPLERTQ